jgi:tRNA dimethylallyltransferase
MNSFAYFIVGPTASGKSGVAQYIAEREGQLIVSADSMNLYRGMDIGTAKPTESERLKATYAGFDVADPTEKFNVAAYLNAVRPAFESGREIIVAGGTGLYVKCLTEGFDDVSPENKKLRAELESLEFTELEKRAKLDAPDRYAALTPDDQQNPRRLIRILEKVAGGTMSSLSANDRGDLSVRRADNGDIVPPAGSWNSKPKPVIVGLHVEREILVGRIADRVERMYADGLLEEAKGLIELDLSQTAMQAIGYAEAFAVLRNEMTLEEAKEKTVIRTRQLAKRQMTWFRNQLNVEWVDTAKYATKEELASAVKTVWDRTGPTYVRI